MDSEISNVEVRAFRNQPGQPLEGSQGSSEVAERQKRAFRSYITHGETRDITTSSSSINGAALVPQSFQGVMNDALKYYGPVATLVGQKVTNLNGAPMKISESDDTSNSLTVLGETTAVSEVDPSAFVATILYTDTVTTGVVKVSIQELQDSYFDLDSWLRDKFGLRYGRGLEAMVTNGNSSNVASLLTGAFAAVTALGNGTANGGTSTVSGTTGANSIGYTDIVALYGALDPAYAVNASWMMNSATRAMLLGVKNTFGQPIYIPNPTTGSFDKLLGQPVVLNQSLPNVAASAVGTIVFGDLAKGYLLRTDGGLSIVRLNERYMDALEVGFIGYSRIGGMSLNPDRPSRFSS